MSCRCHTGGIAGRCVTQLLALGNQLVNTAALQAQQCVAAMHGQPLQWYRAGWRVIVAMPTIGIFPQHLKGWKNSSASSRSPGLVKVN